MSRRMSMPHPGRDAVRAARVVFGTADPSTDQCLAVVDLAGALRADGKLPASVKPMHVVYPERPGAGVCLCTGAVQERVDERIAELFGGVPA